MKKLQREFFAPDTEIVAKNLLWKVIKVGNKYWIIVETEAYKQDCDEASHAWWRKTSRNSLMYDTYGYVYVYLIYGMYYCLNFTTDKNKAWAVLLRCIKVLPSNNLEKFNFNDLQSVEWPGRLTKYFGIDKSFNQLDLLNNDKIEVFDIWLKVNNIEKTKRIWIKKATDKLWRFVLYNDKQVNK